MSGSMSGTGFPVLLQFCFGLLQKIEGVTFNAGILPGNWDHIGI